MTKASVGATPACGAGEQPQVFVVAVWTSTADRAGQVEAILRQLSRASLDEAGCLQFDVLASTERPGRFVLFETYADDKARSEHRASEHFERLVLEGAVGIGVEREIDICTPVRP